MDETNPEQTEAAWDPDAKLEILAEAGGTLVVGNPAGLRSLGRLCFELAKRPPGIHSHLDAASGRVDATSDTVLTIMVADANGEVPGMR